MTLARITKFYLRPTTTNTPVFVITFRALNVGMSLKRKRQSEVPAEKNRYFTAIGFSAENFLGGSTDDVARHVSIAQIICFLAIVYL